MTTLVTGAAGFIGSHVTRLLVEKGDAVRVLVRPASRLDAIADLPVEIVKGDLCDPPTLGPALSGITRVFHVAADYRLWARDPQSILDSNVNGTRNLLRACRGIGLERFVYTSSVATIAAPRAGTVSDETSVAALSEMVGPYKQSKLLAEHEALQAASEGIPLVVVNPTTPVGPGDWKPTPTGRMIVDFLRGRMFAYLKTGLNLVPVEDVAAGHLLAAERGRIGERYLLGGDNMYLKEIFGTLAIISGKRRPVLRMPHAAAMAVGYGSEFIARFNGGEPAVSLDSVRMARHAMFVSSSKAQRELGFASGSVKCALERAVAWYVSRGYVAAANVS
jgi:dihydroflavonol-4-reductase